MTPKNQGSGKGVGYGFGELSLVRRMVGLSVDHLGMIHSSLIIFCACEREVVPFTFVQFLKVKATGNILAEKIKSNTWYKGKR